MMTKRFERTTPGFARNLVDELTERCNRERAINTIRADKLIAAHSGGLHLLTASLWLHFPP
jgi:hypothetical protein